MMIVIGTGASIVATAGGANALLGAVSAGKIVGGTATSVAIVTLTVGSTGGMAVIGLNDVVKLYMGYNFLKDRVFKGNALAYHAFVVGVNGVGMAISIGGAYVRTASGAKSVASIASKETSGVCFVAGTQVATENGLNPIEEVEPGQLVYSENPETGDKGLRKIVQTFVNETNELLHINVGGQSISATSEHPFYLPKKGWTSAIDLRAGEFW